MPFLIFLTNDNSSPDTIHRFIVSREFLNEFFLCRSKICLLLLLCQLLLRHMHRVSFGLFRPIHIHTQVCLVVTFSIFSPKQPLLRILICLQFHVSGQQPETCRCRNDCRPFLPVFPAPFPADCPSEHRQSKRYSTYNHIFPLFIHKPFVRSEYPIYALTI